MKRMSIFQKIKGTIESVWQIGLGGPLFKDNSGVLEARNAADSDYVRLKALAPVDDNDLVTKKYADTLSKPVIIADQVDTSLNKY